MLLLPREPKFSSHIPLQNSAYTKPSQNPPLAPERPSRAHRGDELPVGAMCPEPPTKLLTGPGPRLGAGRRCRCPHGAGGSSTRLSPLLSPPKPREASPLLSPGPPLPALPSSRRSPLARVSQGTEASTSAPATAGPPAAASAPLSCRRARPHGFQRFSRQRRCSRWQLPVAAPRRRPRLPAAPLRTRPRWGRCHRPFAGARPRLPG